MKLVPFHSTLKNVNASNNQWWHMPLILAFGRHRQADLSRSKPAWSTERIQGQPELHRKPCLDGEKKVRTSQAC